eukprot:8828506-Alexandrium_andersonii.AAC.1
MGASRAQGHAAQRGRKQQGGRQRWRAREELRGLRAAAAVERPEARAHRAPVGQAAAAPAPPGRWRACWQGL